MRILLAHNSLYYPSHGGGDKSNRLLMEALAARGHSVRVVTRVERFGQADHDQLVAALAERGHAATPTADGGLEYVRNGVDVQVLTLDPGLRAFFSKHITRFDPDVILTSTDDPGQLLFDLAVKAPRARVVHLVRATIAVPFGPDSSAPNARKAELLKHADGVVGVSQYVARYVREWGGIDAVHVPISLLDPVTEYPDLGRFDNRYVSLANPCAVKGIDIFVELADRMPGVAFAAVPTWGTTEEDVARLRQRANITILPPVDNIDDLLRETKVLLVPSVWAEARSRIVPEAMSRGVPVISSNAGGLPEAHLGVDYVLPVNVITRYKPSLDPKMVPVPDVPPQDVGPWQAALDRLLSDREHWTTVSRKSREAAIGYAENLNVLPFESYLEDVLKRPPKAAPTAGLSDVKRRLLAARLKQGAISSASRDVWLEGIEPTNPSGLTLFCFPYAGGSTLAFRPWRGELREVADVVPVSLPGRGARASEPPIESMEQLIEQLGRAIRPHLAGRRFAFFGHSMGAGIAFELARLLERESAPLPETLVVSAAKAPAFRTASTAEPDPSDAELVSRLQSLGGLPPDVAANPDLLRIVLPALRADARLYRRYVYKPGPALPVPIRIYGASDDRNASQEHLERWCEQTTAGCLLRMFSGGHFYFNSDSSAFFAALREDLKQS